MSPIVLYPSGSGIGQGGSGGPTHGSGKAVPGGVESIFEYNNLQMNVRKWWETYLITEIDGLDDADIRDQRENNPGFDGETAFDAFYGGRTIVLSGKIRAYSLDKLRDMIQAMRRAFSDLNEKPLIIRGKTSESDVIIHVRKYQKLVIKETQTNFNYERAFQIALRASDPFFRSYQEHYAFAYAPTNGSTSASVSVINRGDYESKPRFRIVGPISNPSLTNISTGVTASFNIGLAAGDYLEIDSLRQTIIDNNDIPQFGAYDVTSEFPLLESGPNVIQLAGSAAVAGQTAIQVFWRDTWS